MESAAAAACQYRKKGSGRSGVTGNFSQKDNKQYDNWYDNHDRQYFKSADYLPKPAGKSGWIDGRSQAQATAKQDENPPG